MHFRSRLGHCNLAISAGERQSGWLPVYILPSTAIGTEPPVEDVEIYAVVSTKRETETAGEHQATAPSSMPESFLFDRPPSGKAPTLPEDSNPNNVIFNEYRKTIADCYEWLWFLGLAGHDPLQISHAKIGNGSRPSNAPYFKGAVEMASADNEYSSPCISSNKDNNGLPTTTAISTLESKPRSFSNEELANIVGIQLANIDQDSSSHSEPVEKPICVQNRVDFSYPLSWMREHLYELQQLAIEVRTVLPFVRDACRKENCFRASILKKQHEVQPLPINLHYQIFSVRSHALSREGNKGNSSKKKNDVQYFSRSDLVPENHDKTEFLHSLSCGSLSPHYLGYKDGGLCYQEELLAINLQELNASKLKLHETMAKDVQHNGFVRLDSENISNLTSDMGKRLLSVESTWIRIGRRRVYAISQALSVAVNAFLLKLGFLAEGRIPKGECEAWVKEPGFLIVFEGLLSVVGKERAMLEDTISAVEALKIFQIRLVPDFSVKDFKNDESKTESARERTQRRKSQTNAPAAASSDASEVNDVESAESADIDSEEEDEIGDEEEDDGFPMEVDMEFSGREVLLYIPLNGFRKLPVFLQNGMLSPSGVVIKLFPVLFTQVLMRYHYSSRQP